MINDLQNGRFEKKLILSKGFICPSCFTQVIFLDDKSCYCPKESIKYYRIHKLTRVFNDFYGNNYFFERYSNNQLKVLEVLLENKFSNVRSIAILCQLRKDTIQHVLYKLIEKGLLLRKKTNKKFFYFLKKTNKLIKTINNRGFKNERISR